ncbi:helix-turn-helix domain-containing protein [Oceanobacillus kimchii]|uniref:helix-turn-helix domain-containing protein n=1 Tax=Oceanobacillus kimchii TaxID=746691 RepID=UPI000347A641|nr:helix-turn-helix domain-containing protein [Oceanobacillus kimchii]
MFLERIILYCFEKIQAERSASSIYYLLTAKKSIQTVQDAYLYRIDSFYGILPSLSKETYDKKIVHLHRHHYLTQMDNSYFETTTKGKEFVDMQPAQIEGFHGIEYHQLVQPFTDRLLLLIQTIANTYQRNYNFIPTTDKWIAESFVKRKFHLYKDHLDIIQTRLYQELHQQLLLLGDTEASIFVDRLSGYNYYGLSMEQLSQKYKLDHENIELLLSKVIMQFLYNIHKKLDKYPIMQSIIEDLRDDHTTLSSSAAKTYTLLKKGHQINDIVRIRNLKINTIQDHIVEIAIRDHHFPIYNFVSKETVEIIFQAMKRSNTFRLREIKQCLDTNVSYFEIRLTLALIGTSRGETNDRVQI